MDNNLTVCFCNYFEGNRDDYLNLAVPLYEASITSDWEAAKLIFEKRPDMVRFGLIKNSGTALHVAAIADQNQWTKKNLDFVKNLVDMMTIDDLELKNKHSNTAFWIATAFGDMEMAMIMMEKNPNLLNIRGSAGLLPLSVSAFTGRHSTVRYLYNSSQKMSGDHWTESDMDFTLLHCVERDFFGKQFLSISDALHCTIIA
ncbi:putative ankyrin repeat-containing domain-containing protein [Helianthus annuus]|nr:putative ankyrin repeat-containing domain-containing protein [Helianthus annuus]